MSKNTKIIAIVGGVLILGLVIYMGASKGGFGSAFEAMGCGGKKKAKNKRGVVDLETAKWNDCRKLGYIAKHDAKGNVVRKGKKAEPDGTMKEAKLNCLKLWKTKCGDDNFKKKNAAGCKQKAAALAKQGGGDDADEKDDD